MMMSYKVAFGAVALLAGLATAAAAQAAIVVLAPDATAFAAAGSSEANSTVHASSGLYTAQTGTLAASGNTASAYASLSQGIVRSYASAGSSHYDSIALSQSSFADTLHFNNISGGYVALSLRYAVDGDFSQNPNDFAPVTDGSAGLRLYGCGSCSNVLNQDVQLGTLGLVAGDQARMHFNFGGGTSFEDFGNPIDSQRFTTGSTFSAGHLTGFIATTLLIPTGLTTLGIGADLNLDCRHGAVCDFGHTGQFSFGPLATGLSFTSESGTFLSAPPSVGARGVPEPASWALMITGFGFTGAVLRRRRHGVLSTACSETPAA